MNQSQNLLFGFILLLGFGWICECDSLWATSSESLTFKKTYTNFGNLLSHFPIILLSSKLSGMNLNHNDSSCLIPCSCGAMSKAIEKNVMWFFLKALTRSSHRQNCKSWCTLYQILIELSHWWFNRNIRWLSLSSLDFPSIDTIALTSILQVNLNPSEDGHKTWNLNLEENTLSPSIIV